MATKTLLLLRHAKSSWDDAQLDDCDRPLNSRGRKAATRMGRLLRGEKFKIDLVLCSTAARARETAERVFAEPSRGPTMRYRDDLYLASAAQTVDLLSRVTELASCILLIGHNPGFEEIVAQVTGKTIHFPTAALVQIDLPIDHWSEFNQQTRGELKNVWRPRELETH
jgi:phosphohistidine phosphatase